MFDGQCLDARVWSTKPRFFIPLWRVWSQNRFGGCNYNSWTVDSAVQGACTAWQQYSVVFSLCFYAALTLQRCCTNHSIVCAGAAASCSTESSNFYALPPHQLCVWWRLAFTPHPHPDRVHPQPVCPLLGRPHRCGLWVCAVLFCSACHDGCCSLWWLLIVLLPPE